MVGAAGEAVVFHRESAVTTHMRQNRFAFVGKKMSIIIEFNKGRTKLFVAYRKNSCNSLILIVLRDILTFFYELFRLDNFYQMLVLFTRPVNNPGKLSEKKDLGRIKEKY